MDEFVLAAQLERARQRAADPDWVLVDDDLSDLLGPVRKHRPPPPTAAPASAPEETGQMTGKTKCPCGQPHPEPTLDERSDFHAALYEAIRAVDSAWGIANRTPSLHDFTDRLGPVSAELGQIKRVV